MGNLQLVAQGDSDVGFATVGRRAAHPGGGGGGGRVAAGRPAPAAAALAVVPELPTQFGESYQARSIPPGTYPGVDATVETVGVANVLVVRQDLPEDVARRLTALLFEAKEQLVAAHPEARRLDHRSALATFPIELHPGAERYYQAAKPLAAPAAPLPRTPGLTGSAGSRA